jgi:mannose-6-phosphate isomerase-like protein (cupin superfamily)
MITICNVEDLDFVPKNWGKEVILHNDSNYCGKILKFKDGAKFSFHFHLEKVETWYVIKGEFILRFIDTENATHYEKRIHAGSVIEISQGDPHQLIALTKGEVLEISTQHFDFDSYRIEKGDSQNESI